VLSLRHVLPAADVDVLADADLAAVPRRAVRDASGGITKYQFEPLAMAIASMLGYTVLFAGVTIWRLSAKG
jgi:hypothetical protein